MKLLIAGGGTGGHVFPGVSVATHFREKFPDARVYFMGSDKPLDQEMVTQTGFSFQAIAQLPAPKSFFSWSFIPFGLNSFFNLMRSVIRVRQIRPDAVLGLGGYASVAPVLAARLLGIPALLFEANIKPGKANLFLSYFVKEVAVGFGVEKGFFKRNRVYVTGIPVRPTLLAAARDLWPKTSDSFTLLVMGGSSGAQFLNETALRAYPYLKKAIPHLRLIHLTGKTQFEEVQNRYRKMGSNGSVELYPFRADMENVFKRADAVVARSGASSLAEFALWELPSLLIPYPHSAEEHQVKNAQFFEQVGAATLILEKDLTPERLVTQVSKWVHEPNGLEAMRAAAKNLAKEDAAEKIAALLKGKMR